MLCVLQKKLKYLYKLAQLIFFLKIIFISMTFKKKIQLIIRYNIDKVLQMFTSHLQGVF